jgi:hypothetical protein
VGRWRRRHDPSPLLTQESHVSAARDLRYAGVLGPRSAWRKDIVPKPRERQPACNDAGASGPAKPREEPKKNDASPQRPERSGEAAGPARPAGSGASSVMAPSAVRPGDVTVLSPNVLSVQHWDRLLGGVLYAATPRVEWAALLRRSFAADVLECPKCHGRLRVLAVITEPEPVRRILAHLGQETDTPPLARARDPTDELDDAEWAGQLGLGLA